MKTEIEKTVENLVRSEIICCVSALVDDAVRSCWVTEDHDEGELMDLCSGPVDYDEAALQHLGAALQGRDNGNENDVSHVNEAIEWMREEGHMPKASGLPDPHPEDILSGNPEAARDYCYEFDVDVYDYQREVFEHWAVAPMLADNLESRGETVVRDWHGLTIWARTTTGQSIEMDGVIQRIAEDLLERVNG